MIRKLQIVRLLSPIQTAGTERKIIFTIKTLKHENFYAKQLSFNSLLAKKRIIFEVSLLNLLTRKNDAFSGSAAKLIHFFALCKF